MIENNNIFQEIKAYGTARFLADRLFIEADKPGRYICPACGSGSGEHGTAAFSLHPRLGLFRCFSCGLHGDIAQILKDAYSLNTAEALRKIKDILGGFEPSRAEQLRTDEEQREQIKEKRSREQGRRIIYACRQAAEKDQEFKEYLQARGIMPATAAEYNLGLHTYAGPALADGSGIINKYLLIPYTDTYFTKRLISGIGSRYLKDKGPAPLLYYATFERNRISPNRSLFVAEGELDALAIRQATGQAVGLGQAAQAVGLGSACNTENLLKALPDGFSENIYLFLDNDDAGRRAAYQLRSQILSSGRLKPGKICKIIIPPEGCKDPADIAAAGAQSPRSSPAALMYQFLCQTVNN